MLPILASYQLAARPLNNIFKRLAASLGALAIHILAAPVLDVFVREMHTQDTHPISRHQR